MKGRWRASLAAVLAFSFWACTNPSPGEGLTPGTPEPTQAPLPTSPDRTGQPLWLIKHGWDIPDPAFVELNVATMEQRGFDGVVIKIPSSGNVLSQTPVSYEQLRDELAPLGRTQFTTMDRNFVIIYQGDLGSYVDDWTVPEANVANLARAAREVGLHGIVYDNENYQGVLWDWKREEAPTGLREAEEHVMAKGHDVMSAIEAQWPTATVLVLIGPWVSHDSTADHFERRFFWNDITWANELLGPFFLGMLSAIGDSQVTLVDGGEVYSARSDEDFQHLYGWLKGGVAGDEDLLPAAARSSYAESVSVAFGVYDRPVPGAPMDARVWQETLTNAIRTADRYVWAYTELYDWWGTGWPEEPVPQSFVDATAAAKVEGGR
jgi:hypothetical protein